MDANTKGDSAPVSGPSMGSLDDYQDAADLCNRHSEEGVIFMLVVGKAGVPNSSVWGNAYHEEHLAALVEACRTRVNINREIMGLGPLS